MCNEPGLINIVQSPNGQPQGHALPSQKGAKQLEYLQTVTTLQKHSSLPSTASLSIWCFSCAASVTPIHSFLTLPRNTISGCGHQKSRLVTSCLLAQTQAADTQIRPRMTHSSTFCLEYAHMA